MRDRSALKPPGGRSFLGAMGKGSASLQDCWGHHDEHPVSTRGQGAEKGLRTPHKHPHTSSVDVPQATFALSPNLRSEMRLVPAPALPGSELCK